MNEEQKKAIVAREQNRLQKLNLEMTKDKAQRMFNAIDYAKEEEKMREPEVRQDGTAICPDCNKELEDVEFLSMGPGYSEFENEVPMMECPVCAERFEITHAVNCEMMDAAQKEERRPFHSRYHAHFGPIGRMW